MINIKDRICIEIGCEIQSNFNFEGETKGIYCTNHKKINMIDVKNRKCIVKNW